MHHAQANLVWPTPNKAFNEGYSIDTFVQSTASGRIESGLFGCVRNQGRRFHEGLDLSPTMYDSQGEAKDPIYAISSGVVVYINSEASTSSYGRYIILEHNEKGLTYYSLYAHISRFSNGIEVGDSIKSGQVIGILGRSANYEIPKSRAHLHLEIGFKLTDHFQDWYDRQGFNSPNYHSNWNGMNLVGIDPLALFTAFRDGQVSSIKDYIDNLTVSARIRIFTDSIPDFVRMHSALVTHSNLDLKVIAWDVGFSKYGLPKQWTPRFANEGIRGNEGDVSLLSYNRRQLSTQSCNMVVNVNHGVPIISQVSLRTLRLLFGLH
ncbi:MAG: M23 family metallopeptidase [Verrucomicrobiota bacterium]|nr:M23 family metallopeptidase [Verrucomicrobiota bacterium]